MKILLDTNLLIRRTHRPIRATKPPSTPWLASTFDGHLVPLGGGLLVEFDSLRLVPLDALALGIHPALDWAVCGGALDVTRGV